MDLSLNHPVSEDGPDGLGLTLLNKSITLPNPVIHCSEGEGVLFFQAAELGLSGCVLEGFGPRNPQVSVATVS